MATRPFTSLATVGAVLVLACGCHGGGGVGLGRGGVWSGPELSTGGPTNWSMNGLPGVGPSNHADIGEMFLCLTGPGRAVITDVRPVQPVGTVEVVAFAVRPNPTLRGGDMLGSGRGTLQDNGFNTADRIVDTQCVSGSGQGYELGLELTVPPGTNAGTRGFQIDYTVGDHTANLTYPAGAIVCSTASVDDPPCKRLILQFGLSAGP
ncbi:MAG TPA: hypothetical protein VND96_06695 [Candidatus Micrarchaeaceae archaeon]|nr:hypothetical protein [Candidatus Micrarchaeaceae archaeon]